jgi:hypothetical protein
MAKSVQAVREPKDIRRVSDEEAKTLVDSGLYRYIGKMEAKRMLGLQNPQPRVSQPAT